MYILYQVVLSSALKRLQVKNLQKKYEIYWRMCIRDDRVKHVHTSAGMAFGSGYFCHFAPVLEPRYISTRPKMLAFCLESQPKQKLHILPRFCWEPRPYVPLYIFNIPSSSLETLGSHHGSTTILSATTMFETHNQRSTATTIFSFTVRAIRESCHHHETFMFFIHENVNTTFA